MDGRGEGFVLVLCCPCLLFWLLLCARRGRQGGRQAGGEGGEGGREGAGAGSRTRHRRGGDSGSEGINSCQRFAGDRKLEVSRESSGANTKVCGGALFVRSERTHNVLLSVRAPSDSPIPLWPIIDVLAFVLTDSILLSFPSAAPAPCPLPSAPAPAPLLSHSSTPWGRPQARNLY